MHQDISRKYAVVQFLSEAAHDVKAIMCSSGTLLFSLFRPGRLTYKGTLFH